MYLWIQANAYYICLFILCYLIYYLCTFFILINSIHLCFKAHIEIQLYLFLINSKWLYLLFFSSTPEFQHMIWWNEVVRKMNKMLMLVAIDDQLKSGLLELDRSFIRVENLTRYLRFLYQFHMKGFQVIFHLWNSCIHSLPCYFVQLIQ